MAVPNRRCHYHSKRSDRPQRQSLAAPGNHPRHAGGDEHYQSADGVVAEDVGGLQNDRPVDLRVRKARHREAAEQMTARQFQTGPDDRRGEDDGDVELLHRDPR